MALDFEDGKKQKPFVSRADRNKTKEKGSSLAAKTIIGRILLSFFTLILCILIAVFSCLFVVVNGECTPLRDRLVLSAMQASATKWLPGLFMSGDTVEAIVASSYVVNTDVISLDEYAASLGKDSAITADKWENAVDGMIFETIKGSTFSGYVLLVKDPSRLYVGTSSDYTKGLPGINIFDMAEKEDAIAIINAGEFADPGGQGTGNNPMGVTFSKGECVWNDSARRTFMGFDKNDRLIVTEPMTKAQAENLGIRDGVCFQTGNALITNEGGNVSIHYADNNTGTAQRTAIGQAADGTVILLVTDGRSASSLGATRNDVIDVMIGYGAISAGMLDGGSSSLMYYEDYYTKFDYDTSKLDQYQKKGLVNKYKAFTTPRRMPTYFCVAKQAPTTSESQE
ncbi:MAG: phosphodiester glycosidase family protein [Clostridia bacterium]|nr:phosphodiester glycosidase family protein [Clostridia bacterium]